MEKWAALLLLAGIVGGISICCPGWGKAPASILRAPAPAPDAQAALNSSGANAAMAGSAVREGIFCPSPALPRPRRRKTAHCRRAAGRRPNSRQQRTEGRNR